MGHVVVYPCSPKMLPDLLSYSCTLCPTQKIMRNSQLYCQTPPSITIRMKSISTTLNQQRKGTKLKQACAQKAQRMHGKNIHLISKPKHARGPCLIIQRQEMATFFKLFDDDLIQDFLWMDCCCKVSDKVMAIAPSHYIWQRIRPLHHSGAIRRYTQNDVKLPRGPCCTPVQCSLCTQKEDYLSRHISSSSSCESLIVTKKDLHPKQHSHGMDINCYPAMDKQSTQNGERKYNAGGKDRSMDWFNGNEE